MIKNNSTIRKFCAILALVVLAIVFLPTSCTKELPDEPEGNFITMITQASEVSFYLQKLEAGDVIIDWGDGEGSIAIDFEKASDYYYSNISHNYSLASAHHITITGNISHLDCSANQLTELDVSSNTELQRLDCTNNQLTKLDVSRNTILAVLYCGYNQLTILDVSRNTALVGLDCKNNQLTTLDVNRNTALTDLCCNDNQLTKLDMSNTALTRLRCQYNQLTTFALNDLFRTLPENLSLTKKSPDPWYHIYIYGNPGSSDCKVSIAEEKWWTVVAE